MQTQARSGTVFQTLRVEILEGRLLPGDPVNEVQIAKRLGVSPTPVREAIMDLVGEGFIEGTANRRRRVARYSPGRAAELIQLQGLLHQFGLRRIDAVGTGAEISYLADCFEAASQALLNGDGTAIDSATASVVDATCRGARNFALSVTLPRASQRGFALVLLPAEAWQLWRDWGHTMEQFTVSLRQNEVSEVADRYLTAEFALAVKIAALGSETPRSQPALVIGKTRAEAVAERIRAQIMQGALGPHRAIREVELAQLYGVSTTPVREALRLLLADGLIEVESNRRRRVAFRTTNEINDLLDLLHHLTQWQLSIGLPRMPEPDFDAMRGVAARLGDLIDRRSREGFPDQVLALWECFGRAAGNQEVSRVVRTLVSVLLARLASATTDLVDFGTLYCRLADVPFGDREQALPTVLSDMIDTARMTHDA